MAKLALVVLYVSLVKVRKGRIRRTSIICNDLIYRPLQGVRKYKPCGQTDRRTDKQTDIRTDKQTDRRTDKQTDRRKDKQTDRRTGKQTDRQVCIYQKRDSVLQTENYYVPNWLFSGIFTGLFAGHDSTRGLGHVVVKMSRVGSGQEVFSISRVGSGRVGSRGFQISWIGSGRVKSFSNLTGRVGSGQEVMKSSPVGSGHDPREAGHRGRASMTCELFFTDPRLGPAHLARGSEI